MVHIIGLFDVYFDQPFRGISWVSHGKLQCAIAVISTKHPLETHGRLMGQYYKSVGYSWVTNGTLMVKPMVD